MSIRLSKAIKECNVGLQTAVDFLNKKGSAEVEANLNTKISDEQYELLLKEFKPDSVLKDAANHMLQQQKEEKEREEKEKAEAKAKAKAEAEAKAKAEEEAKAKAELEKKGIECKLSAFADTSQLFSVTTEACNFADAIYVPTDNTVANNATAIDSICRPAGVPIIAGEAGICAGCGIATMSIDYYDLGYLTGEMAVQILKDGADITKMPECLK